MVKKRQQRKQQAPIPERAEPLRIHTYTITTEPIVDQAYKRLPKNVKEQVEQLHDLTLQRPQAAIPELVALREQYPHVHQFANYLVIAYSRTHQHELAKQLIEENYRRDLNYLFARTHYAELCLHDGKLAEVATIFDHKFDLKLLYPERKRFHISEVLAFFGVMGNYFVATGDRERAEQCYQLLHEVDPKHSYTRSLKRKLYPGPFRRLLNSLIRKTQR